jgi:adenylyltransferase/sulfurtransferase
MPLDAPTCAEAGVLGSMAGLVGGLVARLGLTPNAVPGEAALHVLDGLSLEFRKVRVRKRADCAACGAGARLVLADAADPSCPVPDRST